MSTSVRAAATIALAFAAACSSAGSQLVEFPILDNDVPVLDGGPVADSGKPDGTDRTGRPPVVDGSPDSGSCSCTNGGNHLDASDGSTTLPGDETSPINVTGDDSSAPTTATDSGTPATDSGVSIADSSTTQDSGTGSTPDSGPPSADGGPMPDAGSVVDADTSNPDGGTAAGDSGNTVDTGSATDCGIRDCVGEFDRCVAVCDQQHSNHTTCVYYQQCVDACNCAEADCSHENHGNR